MQTRRGLQGLKVDNDIDLITTIYAFLQRVSVASNHVTVRKDHRHSEGAVDEGFYPLGW